MYSISYVIIINVIFNVYVNIMEVLITTYRVVLKTTDNVQQ